MRTRALRRLVAALAALALIAAACGDDDSTDTTADSGSTDNGSTDDGSTDDGSTDDGSTDDGSTDDMADMADDDMGEDDMGEDHADHDDDHEDHADHADHGDDMAGEDMGHGDDSHDHGEPVEFTGTDVPTVALEVEADPAGGINVHVTTTNYTVNAAAASTDHVEGEGHYHLYIDGEKALRFYNDSIYYAGVVEGDVDVMVELSANDHRAYAVDGEPIMAMQTFTVPEHSHDAHSHDDPDPVDWEGGAVSIDLVVEDDPKSGWNAFVTLDGMTLSPEHVNGDHVAGEGHLHIYANGQKLGRLYGTATHIGTLPEGDVEVSVVAYTNDHMPYLLDGEPISAAVTVSVAS